LVAVEQPPEAHQIQFSSGQLFTRTIEDLGQQPPLGYLIQDGRCA